MVKRKTTKKAIAVSGKSQLLIVCGAVLLLMGLGFFVAWLDHRVDIMPGSSTYHDVTIQGEAVCLPVRDQSKTTDKSCIQAIKTSGGVNYAIDGTIMKHDDSHSEATGTLKAAASNSNYDVAGVLKVE